MASKKINSVEINRCKNYIHNSCACMCIMERACCVVNIYVNVHDYHEYKTFCDASVGEVSARGNFPTQKTIMVLCIHFAEAMAAEELSFDKPLHGYRYWSGD